MRSLMFTFFCVFGLAGCGSQREIETTTPKPPQPTSTPKPGGGDVTFADVQAITKDACWRCHSTAQFLKSEAAWRGSDAKNRLVARTMPQAGSPEAKALSDEDRATLIGF